MYRIVRAIIGLWRIAMAGAGGLSAQVPLQDPFRIRRVKRN